MRSESACYVYILAGQTGGTLYVGVTNNLPRRMFEHQSGTGSVFTAKYDVHSRVFFEAYADPEQAIRREKQIKRWRRAWKVRLIEENNPNWTDLSKGLF
ncbi:GIY-YIG nuclease family protein [Roseibium litorale]|uniref:GIY-YIG nuclease family protein n=1 Tax=Roseibium litorale TaxID=2803841 RepID=A0ABR9CIU3_9HYPH|nr:GIY-YIG nuclease family protein [Roseibium litorale]MBD8890559.1 GIY-YIG nuclease family protein [Roseibium litorale]